jgi:predicted dehydrogenase
MLKIGIFGAGHLGKFHISNWQEIEHIEIVGFHDSNSETALEVEKKFGIKHFENIDELIDLIDAADIITPTQYHYSICENLLRKSKHVFVEKPMVNNMEEANEILKLVRESGTKFQVGHVERFNPALLALKGRSLNPMFIEVHRLAQFNPRGTEVSVILDLMIHDIDIILHLVKSDIKNISASGVSVMTETPDIANVRIEFHNGCVANLTSSRISMKKMRKMRLFQKDSYIGIDFLEKKTEIIKLKSDEDQDLFSFDIETPNGVRTIAVENPEITNTNAIKSELTAFRDSILQDKPTQVSELDGYMAMDVAHQILQKIKQAAVENSIS